MSVNVLLVEVKLDAEVLGAILAGRPVVKEAGPKNSLAPRTRVERRERRTCDVCYLRDRDFDHDPPTEPSRPQVDRTDDDGSVLGWRWCRHEIESYLIDPDPVANATGWDRDEYARALTSAAVRLRHYQVARWAIGTVRRQLLPPHHLRTRPDECGNVPYRLPGDLSQEATATWACEHAMRFRQHVEEGLSARAVQIELESRRRAVTEELLARPADALLWCSGKDLLAALDPWLVDHGARSAASFVAQVRDWVRSNPERALGLFPEWLALSRIAAS